MVRDEIINFWRRLPTEAAPFVHPDDIPILSSSRAGHTSERPIDFDAFISSARFGGINDKKLHLSLLPIPYIGDIGRADIFILLLNPGFSPADYYAEYRHAGFRERAIRTIQQDSLEGALPFYFLDPHLCWHPGFSWWEEKLRGIASTLATHRYQGRYDRALSELASRIAAVELVPYHSRFYGGLPVDRLPSSLAAIEFARNVLAPRAANNEILVIVTRQIRQWGLPPSDGVVTYEGLERSASLGIMSPGGKAILRRLSISL
ncbi:MAG: hypothetical protein ACM31L_07240 [Actinomycetota bacterium]